jgi:hypothetical protein
MLRIKAFIDDSRSIDPPVYVLGGFIAPANAWESFSNEWQQILDGPPRLDYFKMQEAYALHGQFEDWRADRRDEWVRLFFNVIKKHVRAAISVSVNPEDIKKIYGPRDKFATHPFYLAAISMITKTVRAREALGIEYGIDFVFDDQMHEKRHLIATWKNVMRVVQLDPEIERLLPIVPQFANDKDVLPLQAADMHAWWMRRRHWELYSGRQPTAFPGEGNFQFLHVNWDEAALRESFLLNAHIAASISGKFGPIIYAPARWN